MHAYEWATVRVVPRVEREEFVNAGVLVYCQSLAYLVAAVELDEPAVRALWPATDVPGVRRHLDALVAVCHGAAAAGPAAGRPLGERFRRLVAPRSTVVQLSPVHTGVTPGPTTALDEQVRRLLDSLVRRPHGPEED